MILSGLKLQLNNNGLRDICTRQILPSKVDPRTVRVKLSLMAVDR